MVISNSILLFLNISIFSVGLYFVLRSIQSLTRKQDELIKQIADIQHRVDKMNVNIDRINRTVWDVHSDVDSITEILLAGDEDLA
jgi:predicted  nucleic acid-binding Zn-ribbon protein